VLQAAVVDCLSFDPFAFEEDRLCLSKVNVGWREFFQALVVALMVVVFDKPLCDLHALDIGPRSITPYRQRHIIAPHLFKMRKMLLGSQ
jgi:hypothetical protein